MNRKYFKPLVIIVALFVVCAITISSYAYFTASVNSSANANVITTGNMEITFEDGNTFGFGENFLPGDSVSINFNVRNTGDVYSAYDLYLNDVINTFVNKDELVYELISADGVNISESECPATSSVIYQGIGIDVGDTHHYTLKVTFLNKDYSQDDNQNATFHASVYLTQSNTLREVAMTDYYYIPSIGETYEADDPNFDIDEYVDTNGGEYFKYSETSYYATVSKYYVRGTKSIINVNSMEECNAYIDSIPEREMEAIFDIYCKYEDGAYYGYVAYNPDWMEGYYDHLGVKATYLSLSECEEGSSRLGSTDIPVCIFESGIPREMKIKGDVEKKEVCISLNGETYCDGARPSWSGVNSSAAQDFINYHKSNGFTCNDEVYDNLSQSLVCYIGNDPYKGFYYFPDGRLMAGTVIASYHKMLLDTAYDNIYDCEVGSIRCLPYQGKYYRYVSTYDGETGCLNDSYYENSGHTTVCAHIIETDGFNKANTGLESDGDIIYSNPK